MKVHVQYRSEEGKARKSGQQDLFSLFAPHVSVPVKRLVSRHLTIQMLVATAPGICVSHVSVATWQLTYREGEENGEKGRQGREGREREREMVNRKWGTS